MSSSLQQVFEAVKPKMPKKQKIDKIGDVNIYIVDGDYIRNYIDIDFTNFGQHYRFDFIPEKEFWIDHVADKSEIDFFITHLLKEYQLMRNKMSYKKANELADVKERDERRSATGHMLHIRPDVNADIHKKYWKTVDGVKIWIVNGRKIRDNFKIDFTEGGHGYVYGFIPKDEVWVEDSVIKEERKFVLIHELKERELMKEKGWPYVKSHKEATRVEHLARASTNEGIIIESKRDNSFDSKDTNHFYDLLFDVAEKKGFTKEVLGKLESGDSIYLFTRPVEDKPKLLIASGFHGEERAGFWGLLAYLKKATESELDDISLSFIPIVNPTGIQMGRRMNKWWQNPNRGFTEHKKKTEKPSKEGEILKDHIDKLKELASDGFLSVHEDNRMDKFYIYTFEHRDKPGKFTKKLKDTEEKHFDPKPDTDSEKTGKVRESVVFKDHDGSFEDLMFKKGSEYTATTETPGKKDIYKRIEANADIIKSFINFFIE
jgi:hypothetical protein